MAEADKNGEDDAIGAADDEDIGDDACAERIGGTGSIIIGCVSISIGVAAAAAAATATFDSPRMACIVAIANAGGGGGGIGSDLDTAIGVNGALDPRKEGGGGGIGRARGVTAAGGEGFEAAATRGTTSTFTAIGRSSLIACGPNSS